MPTQQPPTTKTMTGQRESDAGDTIDAAALQDLLQTALAHPTIVDPVNEMLHEHVIQGRYHPTVIAGSLRSMITDALYAATDEDWQTIANSLIADTRNTLNPDQPDS